MLNAFEMLWAPGRKEAVHSNERVSGAELKDDLEIVANQPIEEMNLVEIRSHSDVDTPKPLEERKQTVPGREEVKGFALTVKDSYIDSILEICERVRPETFLSLGCSEEKPFAFAGGQTQHLVVADECALICAIDSRQI